MVSILLATYNGEKYIKESLDSVLNQTFSDFELLIGLNGTTDNTKDILYSYSDPRIKIFDYGNDKGKSKTLNKLVKEAKYDYISLQDDDDVWNEKKLEIQSLFITKFDVVGTYIQYIDEKGKFSSIPNLSSEDYHIKFRSLNGDNQVANTSTIFRKNDCEHIGGWNTNLDGIEDFDFWLRLMRLGKMFFNVPECLVYHRLHDRSNFNTQSYNIQKII